MRIVGLVAVPVLAEKESRLCDPPAGTPLIPPDADSAKVLAELDE